MAQVLRRIPHDRAYELFLDGQRGDAVNELIHDQPFLVAALGDVRESDVRTHYIEGIAVYHRALKREMQMQAIGPEAQEVQV